MALAIPALELQMLLDYAPTVGLRFIKSDDVNIGMSCAVVLLTLMDERLSTVSNGEYDQPWVQEMVNARDELERAVQHAKDMS